MDSVSCGSHHKVVAPPQSQAQPSRFAFVDGLRGLAALGIAVYHIWRYEPPAYPSVEFVPSIVDWILLRSWIGVQFLLVISGFVIAFTLRNTWVTPREAFSFVARRVVRLWPPYAVTLLIVIALHAACVTWWALPSPVDEPLTISRVLSHFVFLQDVLGEAPLSAGIWTVCIEMQFYIVCIVGWGLAQRFLTRRNSETLRPPASALLLIFGPLAVVSLFVWNRQDSTEPWVTHFLCSFFLGMVTWWTLDRTVPMWAYCGVVAVVLGYLALQWKLENALALTAALALYLAGRTGHLHDWLNWRWLQYLGRISYSLYLIHYPVSHLLTWIGWRMCGDNPSPIQASTILLVCVFGSIAAGHLLYVCLEAPSGRWSARMKCHRNAVEPKPAFISALPTPSHGG